MTSEAHHQPLHVFFFPLMAHGHMIPMLDIARLFAARGVKSTVITTPLNASVFSSSVDRERSCGRDINILITPFPSIEAGLPEGCESLRLITSLEMIESFSKATNMLQKPLEQLLLEYHPDYIVGDMFFPWLTDVAAKLGIPRLVFHGTCFLSLCATNVVATMDISSKADSIVVLDLPDKIEMKRSQLPGTQLLKMLDEIRESELRSYGAVVNSFYELEPAYAEHYRKVLGKRAWHIGPVSLISNRSNTIDKADQRGQKASIEDEYCCLNWLHGKKPNSVLYVSFGSLFRFNGAQLQEIAMALEASGVPFIWVIKTSKDLDEQYYLPEGFKERIEGKGLIVTDWAPQVLILDHPATGGFMTHCGWNSVIESVSAGVPLITWPLFGEQFYNERLVTQVLRVGIPVGIETWSSWPAVVEDAPVLKRERIEKVVNQLMGCGEEGIEMRERAKEIGQKAKKAVEDDGSSFADFTALMEEMRDYKQKPS